MEAPGRGGSSCAENAVTAGNSPWPLLPIPHPPGLTLEAGLPGWHPTSHTLDIETQIHKEARRGPEGNLPLQAGNQGLFAWLGLCLGVVSIQGRQEQSGGDRGERRYRLIETLEGTSRIKAFERFEWVSNLSLLDPEGLKEIGIFQGCVRLSLSWNSDR